MLTEILTSILFLACFNSCSRDYTDTGLILEAIAKDYPKVDGSTSTHPLQRKLACYILDVPCRWSALSTENIQRTIIPDEEQNIDGELVQVIFNIRHNGTHGSYMNLVEDKADVILVTRGPTEEELKFAEENDVSMVIRAVALDALVFLVNTKNPLDSLPLETIRDIYSGNIRTWTETGISLNQDIKEYETIHLYHRNPNSGEKELMESMVMQKTPVIDAPDLIQFSMLGPFNAIGGDRWEGEGGDLLGIGYALYFYAVYMFPHEHVKVIGVNGVYPSAETISSRLYPLITKIYVVIRKGAAGDSTALLFRNWLLTDEGQMVIEAAGYVPIR